jgi:Protein of unknown function (DUF2752)
VWVWFASAAVLAGAIVLFFFDPARHGFYPRCLLYETTGIYCPGCGTLRGLYQLEHGHLLAAIRMNPLVFLIIPAFAGIHFWRRRQSCRRPVVSTGRSEAVWGWMLLALFLVISIARNVPVYPFNLLAP